MHQIAIQGGSGGSTSINEGDDEVGGNQRSMDLREQVYESKVRL